MGTWHTQFDSQRMSRKAHLRLFSLLIFSIAIHLILIISSPLQWEQKGEGSHAMQIRMGSVHNTPPAPQSSPSVKKMEPQFQNMPTPVTLDKTGSQVAASIKQGEVPTSRVSPENKSIKRRAMAIERTEPPQQAVKTPSQTTMPVKHPIDDKPAAVEKNSRPIHERKKITQHLQQALARHFNYPFQARRRGWQGEVTLAFILEADGRVTDIHITSSSGYIMLDRAALKSLENIGRIKQVPLQALSLELPVIYRLQKG